MFKLRELQKKQAEQNNKAATTTAPASGDATTPAKQNSSELLEIRKQKSRENVFSLKTKASGETSSGKRANAAELRAQKGMIW